MTTRETEGWKLKGYHFTAKIDIKLLDKYF